MRQPLDGIEEFWMKIGKVPENVLKRSIFKQIHTRRPEVVLERAWERTVPR